MKSKKTEFDLTSGDFELANRIISWYLVATREDEKKKKEIETLLFKIRRKIDRV